MRRQSATRDAPQRPELCAGPVVHERLRPRRHRFAYPVFFVRVPLSQWTHAANRWLSLDRFNLLSLHRRDYGPRDGSDLETWARARLRDAGLQSADGEIVLQTFPRMLGYVFNPISIWFCLDRTGFLRAAICEVNNTFGERHNYIVAHPDGRIIRPTEWLTARKMLHVSPFCEVNGHYRFRFDFAADPCFAQIDYHVGDAPDDRVIATAITGRRAPLDARNVLRVSLRYPFLTFAVIARIHWQALRLWWKRVPWFRKPAPPRDDSSFPAPTT
jgi:DUF1365 family protein